MIKEAGYEKNFAQIAKITKVKVISLQIQNNKIKRRSQMFHFFLKKKNVVKIGLGWVREESVCLTIVVASDV